MWVEGWGHLPGQLVVVSGPSGCGKSSLIRRVYETGGLNLRLSVSATTREPRPGETQGLDYHFMTVEQFTDSRDRRDLLEHATYNNRFYGTPARPVFQNLKEGHSVLLEIEVEGAKQVREHAPTALYVFIRTPTFRVLEERLRSRGTETEPSIHRRLQAARHELAEAHWYDVQIVNDDFDRCVEEFTTLLKANGCGG